MNQNLKLPLGEKIKEGVKNRLDITLNTKIAEINTRYNDGITLEEISSSSYQFQTLSSKISNENVFLYYGVSNVTPVENAGAGAEIMMVEVSVMLSDNTEPDIFNRLFRYQQVLKEIFEEAWNGFDRIRQKIDVSMSNPVDFVEDENDTYWKAIGIYFKVSNY